MTKEDYELARYAIDSLFWFGVIWVIGKTVANGWVASRIKL